VIRQVTRLLAAVPPLLFPFFGGVEVALGVNILTDALLHPPRMGASYLYAAVSLFIVAAFLLFIVSDLVDSVRGAASLKRSPNREDLQDLFNSFKGRMILALLGVTLIVSVIGFWTLWHVGTLGNAPSGTTAPSQ
jgi:hypothetical protein